MPPRSSLTSSFSISDANNEVVCPLRNQDGSSCRKRCIGVRSAFPPPLPPPSSAPGSYPRILPPLSDARRRSINCYRHRRSSFFFLRGGGGVSPTSDDFAFQPKTLTNAGHLQEKRYRSMQEHIRRAHPEHYIAKLPATEESFHLMINTPPSERPPIPQNATVASHQSKPYVPDRNAYYRDESSNPGTPRHIDDYPGGLVPAATNAAAALATLHSYRSGGSDYGDGVSNKQPSLSLITLLSKFDQCAHDPLQDWASDSERDRRPRSSVELPPIHINNSDITSEPFSGLNAGRSRELLPSIMATSPPGRSSTLPPLQRPLGPNRTSKSSVSKRRDAYHRKNKSRDTKDWMKRGKIDDLLRPNSQDRPRPYSAEPSARSAWDELLDAATSVATEDINEDRTPVSLRSCTAHTSYRLRIDSSAPDAPVACFYTASLPATVFSPAIWPLNLSGVPLAAGTHAAHLCSRGA